MTDELDTNLDTKLLDKLLDKPLDSQSSNETDSSSIKKTQDPQAEPVEDDNHFLETDILTLTEEDKFA